MFWTQPSGDGMAFGLIGQDEEDKIRVDRAKRRGVMNISIMALNLSVQRYTSPNDQLIPHY
jgi:hypothetical protein